MDSSNETALWYLEVQLSRRSVDFLFGYHQRQIDLTSSAPHTMYVMAGYIMSGRELACIPSTTLQAHKMEPSTSVTGATPWKPNASEATTPCMSNRLQN
jgi:hypothetical protein